jgi:hypothetical protein
MSEWWDALQLEQQIYWTTAIVASVVIGAQTLMMLIGDASELADAGDVDMEGPEGHPSGLHLISSRTLVAFLVGFGWTGVIRATEGGDPALTAVGATLVGLLFAAVIVYMMRFLHSLKYSGTLDYANAIGEIGKVYLPIPPELGGPGRIEVLVQGRLRVVEALTRHDTRLENRVRVRVVDKLDDTTLLVEPLDLNQELED